MTANVRRNLKTRIISWIEFNLSGQKKTIKDYLLFYLKDREPLSTRQISLETKITVQSLTAPIKELREAKVLNWVYSYDPQTRRHVMAYSLKNEAL